jgi:hypothetical protein
MKQPPQGDEDFSSKPKKDREAVEHRYRLVDLEMAKQLLGKDKILTDLKSGEEGS